MRTVSALKHLKHQHCSPLPPSYFTGRCHPRTVLALNATQLLTWRDRKQVLDIPKLRPRLYLAQPVATTSFSSSSVLFATVDELLLCR
jgi:hypothetical protein